MNDFYDIRCGLHLFLETNPHITTDMTPLPPSLMHPITLRMIASKDYLERPTCTPSNTFLTWTPPHRPVALLVKASHT